MKNTSQDSSSKTSDVRILKIGTCPSVSGKSTLTYHIGCTADEIQLRVHANTAAGFFSQEWVPWKSIEDALTKAGSHFNSFSLQPLFQGKSMNTPAFMLAVLLHEKVVGRATDKKRCYQKLDSASFVTSIKVLMESKVSLNADDKPKNVTKKLTTKTAKTTGNTKVGRQTITSK